MTDYQPVPIPAHLPRKLTLTLWDFSWYVRTGPGEPFEDLDRAAAEAVARGYNTVRICAMPFLLFGSGIDTSALELDRLGGDYAQNVRWYVSFFVRVYAPIQLVSTMTSGGSPPVVPVIVQVPSMRRWSSFVSTSVGVEAIPISSSV